MDRFEEFVRSYYSLLETHPENLQPYYGASSMLSRSGPDGKMADFSTLSEIHENIQSFGPKYLHHIFAMCPQVCGNKYGLVVLVTGQVVRKEDNASRNFAQTLFLAVDTDGAFYILTDVFNYVDDPRVAVPEVVSVSSVIDQQESLKSPSATSAAAEEKGAEQPVSNGGNPSQPPPPAQPFNNNGRNYRSGITGTTMYAVHVTKLPLCTQRYHIETLFKKFGTIKQDGGVQVRDHRNDDGEPDYKYAFVEFEKKSSMIAALKASPITVNNRAFPVRRRWYG